jgi:class 3 adenylate cyclase
MRCPSCGSDNPDGGKFCINCGTALGPRCPRCGTDNLPRAKFCGECGTALIGQTPTAFSSYPQPPLNYTPRRLAEKILTSRAALEGERKQVTVLFADLKGSMELLADRDPTEGRQLLDPVLERMMATVHRYEGTVNQVMGDGIMALFGAPIAHEDHAVRACYSALAMQEAIRRYSDEVRRGHGVGVQIRVGLHSGEVVVRSIGNDLHIDYSAIGQTTHLAARMKQLATHGSIRRQAHMRQDVSRLLGVHRKTSSLWLAAEMFQLVVDAFAQACRDSLNLLLPDNSGAPTAQRLTLPENVRLVFLPPYCPELNPIERVWRDLKDALA